MTDGKIVRGAPPQATWTGDKESMIEQQIESTRKAADGYETPVGETVSTS